MSDAPHRIWAWGTTSKGETSRNSRPNRCWWFDEGDMQTKSMPHCHPYILDDPAAISDHPTVKALVAEAEARGMNHIESIERLAIHASVASCTCHTKTPDIAFHSADCRYVTLQYIIAQCEDFRAEAAAIRKGETT